MSEQKNDINNNKIKNEITIKESKSCTNLLRKDFDYPSLNRKDLMSLSTIGKYDFKNRKINQITTNRDWSLNLYNLDIPGAFPRKYSLYVNKPDYTNKNDDIEKSSPNSGIKFLNKPNYNLSNEDIELSKPNCNKLKIKRITNPLMPKYNLSKKQEIEIPPPKFIRDNINIDDIIGSKPKKFISNSFLRDNLNKDDLKDSFPKKRYERKKFYDNFNYKDINQKMSSITRLINPLSPIYSWKYEINNLRYNVGLIEGNSANPFSKFKYNNPFNLRNDDIDGTTPGSKNVIQKFKGTNSCLNISDIKGAIHGSLIKGIFTKRNLNPLQPQYKYLGEEELKIDKEKNENKFDANNNKLFKSVDSKKVIENGISFNINSLKNKNELQNSNNQIDNDNIESSLNELKEFNSIEKPINFDKNLYKKPKEYFPIIHQNNIFPQDKRDNQINSCKNNKVRSFQEVLDEKIKFLKEKKNNQKLLRCPIKSYEDKLDNFLINSTISTAKSYQKANKNAYYDIGLQEDLNPDVIESKI